MDSNHRYRIRKNPFWLPRSAPQFAFRNKNRLFRAGDRWFESISLLRRSHKNPIIPLFQQQAGAAGWRGSLSRDPGEREDVDVIAAEGDGRWIDLVSPRSMPRRRARRAMVAYIDDFKLMMIIIIVALPMLLLLRRPRPIPEAAVVAFD